MVFRMLAALAIEVIAGCRTTWRHSLGSTLARPTSSHGLIVPDSVLSLQNFALVQAGAARKSFAGKVSCCLSRRALSRPSFASTKSECHKNRSITFLVWSRMSSRSSGVKDTGANASIDGSYSHDDALHRSQKLDLSVRVLRAD